MGIEIIQVKRPRFLKQAAARAPAIASGAQAQKGPESLSRDGYSRSEATQRSGNSKEFSTTGRSEPPFSKMGIQPGLRKVPVHPYELG